MGRQATPDTSFGTPPGEQGTGRRQVELQASVLLSRHEGDHCMYIGQQSSRHSPATRDFGVPSTLIARSLGIPSGIIEDPAYADVAGRRDSQRQRSPYQGSPSTFQASRLQKPRQEQGGRASGTWFSSSKEMSSAKVGDPALPESDDIFEEFVRTKAEELDSSNMMRPHLRPQEVTIPKKQWYRSIGTNIHFCNLP